MSSPNSPLPFDMQIGALIIIERLRACVLSLESDFIARDGILFMLSATRTEPWLFDPAVVAWHDAKTAAGELKALPEQGSLVS